MKFNYIFFTTDESFDYHGPFGSQTQKETGYHGFSVEFDDDFKPILSTIEGFGAFSDASENTSRPDEFISWLDENIKHLQSDVECTPYDCFMELREIIEELNYETITKENVHKKQDCIAS